jgi:hypothetical protein
VCGAVQMCDAPSPHDSIHRQSVSAFFTSAVMQRGTFYLVGLLPVPNYWLVVLYVHVDGVAAGLNGRARGAE